MKIIIEFNNLAKTPLRQGFFATAAERVLREPEFAFLENKSLIVSVALVGEMEIKRLNRTYRKKNYVTDVLSFAEYKNLKDLKSAVDKDIFLGELVLCYDDIREYAKKEKIKPEQELAKVVSHGVLHLLGMRHGKAMFEIQEKISKSV